MRFSAGPVFRLEWNLLVAAAVVIGCGQPELMAQNAAQPVPACNLVTYGNFVNFVGEEDAALNNQRNRPGAASLTRTDYANTIGLNAEETQQMISVAVSYYRRLSDVRTAQDDAFQQYLSVNGRGDQTVQRPTSSNEYASLVGGLCSNLEVALGPTDFKKLDQYVNREYGKPRTVRVQSSQGVPCAFPTDIRYGFFISRIRFENQRGLQQAGEDSQRTNFSKLAGYPAELEDLVWNIVLDQDRKLQKSETMDGSPSTMEALASERREIIEETQARLKSSLGETSFNKLDAWIAKHYAGGRIIGTPCPQGTASAD
jgi:hypothetical protein